MERCMNRQLSYRQRHRSASWKFQISLAGSILIIPCLLASCAGASNSSTTQATPTTTQPAQPVTPIPASSPTSTKGNNSIHNYEYVFPDGEMYVYDMDHGHTLVQTISLPTAAGVRGVAASPVTHM